MWSLSQAHACAAKTCLVLLVAEEQRHNGFILPHGSVKKHSAGQPDAGANPYAVFPLLYYAMRAWPRHVRSHGEDDIDPRLATLLKAVLGSMDTSSGAFRRWYTLYWDDQCTEICSSGIYDEVAPESCATFAICYFGFDRILEDWWHIGPADLKRRNRRGNNLLNLAVLSGSLRITRRLLRLGMDVNSPGSSSNGFPLTVAAAQGNMPILQLLLNASSNVNLPGGCSDSPLGAAAREGHVEAVQLLLEAGADINMPGEKYGSPLGAAASSGQNEIVKLLLEAGADINAQGGVFGCPLGVAAACDKLQTVKLLLDAGANVNLPGGEYGCPVGAAAFWRLPAVVKLLLDAGADVNLRGGRYGCPLGAAAYRGHIEIMKLLLDAGADVNLSGGFWGCALRGGRNFGRWRRRQGSTATQCGRRR